MKAYYDARAPEYDDVWLGRGRFAHRHETDWFEEVVRLQGAVASLPAARTLDVACGTGFLTRHLHAELVGVEGSRARGDRDDEWQERILNDGSRWTVYKRYFSAHGLLDELGGGR